MLKSPCRGFFTHVHLDSGFCKYNTRGSQGSSVSCQKWELRICFVSRNMYSVVETVNGIGLSCAGSGTANDVCLVLLSWETWMVNLISIISQCTFCAAFLYVRVTSFSTWLTEETLEEPRHYMICGGRGGGLWRAVEHVSKHSKHSDRRGLKVSAAWEQEKDTIFKTQTTSRTENTAPSMLKLQLHVPALLG